MANQLRVTLEIGPKGKKVAAVAPDWPGLERTLCPGGEAGWDGCRVCSSQHG